MIPVPPEHPKRLVLLGHPVSHSLSPLLQNAALKSAGLQATYDALDVLPDALTSVLRELARGGVAGNVTIPHKEAVRAACVSVTDVAERVGAVNTFWHEKGKLIGDNTDVIGARVAIATLLSERVAPLRVAILGAGGAAAAVLVALEEFSSAAISIAARTSSRAHALGERLGISLHVADSAAAAVKGANMVINCTPIGLKAEELPVAVHELEAGACVLDLIPRNGDTDWVRECRNAGHIAEDGSRMLVEQGAAAFERWFGLVPDRASMWRALKLARTEVATARSKSAGAVTRPA